MKIPGQWIGRHGPLLEPPRFSDLTSLGFFLYGYVSDNVYASAMADIKVLTTGIPHVIQSVP